MKLLRKNKKYILIAFILFIASSIYLYEQHVIVSKLLANFNAAKLNQLKNTSTDPQNMFYSSARNISFMYPAYLQLKYINDSLISLNKIKNPKTTDTLYIYTASISANANNIQLPFKISGKIKSSVSIPVQKFAARQVIYSDGQNETNLLILKQAQQLIVVIIPSNTSTVSDAITDFINSVKTIQ